MPPSKSPPARLPLTLVEMGRRLDLDKSTVSLALRDSPKITAKTRKRVQAFAARHDYRPNLAARHLTGTSLKLVGIVLPDTLSSLTSPVAVRSISILATLVTQAGMLFHLMPSSGVLAPDSSLPLLPDVAVIWGDAPLTVVQALSRRSRPTVVLDPNHSSYGGYDGPALRIANRQGAQAMARHLITAGARRLLFIQERDDHLGHAERWQGAQTAWKQEDDPQFIERCLLADLDDHRLSAFAQVRRGAILCSNDHVAIHVWHRLLRLGFTIPQDVSLAGFDGDEYGSLIRLTTAVFDVDSFARTAFTVVQELLVGKSRSRLLNNPIPLTLRAGETG